MLGCSDGNKGIESTGIVSPSFPTRFSEGEAPNGTAVDEHGCLRASLVKPAMYLGCTTLGINSCLCAPLPAADPKSKQNKIRDKYPDLARWSSFIEKHDICKPEFERVEDYYDMQEGLPLCVKEAAEHVVATFGGGGRPAKL